MTKNKEKKSANVWDGLKNFVIKTSKKLEQSVDNVLNQIDGVNDEQSD